MEKEDIKKETASVSSSKQTYLILFAIIAGLPILTSILVFMEFLEPLPEDLSLFLTVVSKIGMIVLTIWYASKTKMRPIWAVVLGLVTLLPLMVWASLIVLLFRKTTTNRDEKTLAKSRIKFYEEGDYSIEWLWLFEDVEKANEEKIWLAAYQYAKMTYNVSDSGLSSMTLKTFIENILGAIKDSKGKFKRGGLVDKFLRFGKKIEPTDTRKAYVYETNLYFNNQNVKVVETKIPSVTEKETLFRNPEEESRNMSIATVLILIEDLLRSLPEEKLEQFFKILKRMHKFYKENDPDNPLLISKAVHEAFKAV